MAIEDRKNAHIHANLYEDVAYWDVRTGFDDITFVHNALPDPSFGTVNLQSRFMIWDMRVPFLVSSLIGGTEESHRLLTNLASGAAEVGSAIGLGSQRMDSEAIIQSTQHRHSRAMTDFAPMRIDSETGMQSQ